MLRSKSNNKNTGNNSLTTKGNCNTNTTNLFSLVRTRNSLFESKTKRLFSDFSNPLHQKILIEEQSEQKGMAARIPKSIQDLIKVECTIETVGYALQHIRFRKGTAFNQISLEEFCEKMSIKGINAHVIKNDYEKDNSDKYTLVIKETLAKLNSQLSELDTISENKEVIEEAEVEIGTIARPSA